MNITLKVSDTGVVCDCGVTENIARMVGGQFHTTSPEEGYGYIHITGLSRDDFRMLTKEDKKFKTCHWNVSTTTNPPGAWAALFTGRDITVKWPNYRSQVKDCNHANHK